MRAKTLEINWHDSKAVYSVDFSADGSRFASAGADTSVRLWSIKRRSESENTQSSSQKRSAVQSLPVHIEFLSELKRHSAPVNVVRFSPSGEYIASAGDDACIILWKRSTSKEQHTFGREHAEFEKESWSVSQMFYGHNKEIYDLAWSPCGEYFITASIDNTARVWSVAQRAPIHVFADHTHYVQGVAWDPLGQYVATQSSDRSVAIYKYRKDGQGNIRFNSTCSKRHLRMSKKNGEASFRLYHDENLVTFFRRLSFSHEGAFLLTPAGLCKQADENTPEDDDYANCAYLYPRNAMLKMPIAYTSSHTKPSIAVRWCPQTFELRASKKSSLFNLPYRLIYAVATQDGVYIYDTQQARPICVITGMHFAPITDLTWSQDGTVLAFSSADGYCSAVVFEDGELGTIMESQPPDVEMMEITSPPRPDLTAKPIVQPIRPEKRVIPEPSLSTVAMSTASANTENGGGAPKKRRIAPTLISSLLPQK